MVIEWVGLPICLFSPIVTLSIPLRYGCLPNYLTYTYADPDRLSSLFAEGWGFQLLLQSLPDSVLVIQPDGIVAYASVNADVVFGFSPHDLVGRPFHSLVLEEDRSVFPPPPFRGLVGSWDFRVERGDPERWLNATFHTPALDTEGSDLYSVMGDAVIMLVRDLNSTDVNVRDRADLYRRTIDAMDSLIVVTNPLAEDNPIVLANEEFLKFTEYTRGEVVGHNCRLLQARPDGTRDDDQEPLHDLARAIAEGEYASVLLRNYKKGGDLFYNELYITPIRQPDGRVVNFVGVLNDVTDRVQAESEAKTRERLLHRAVEGSSSGIFITGVGGSEGSIIYANPAFATITGHATEDALGSTPWFWWGDGSDQARRDHFFDTVFVGHESHVIAKCERKNGEPYWAEIYASPVEFEGGADRGIVGVITDVTSRVEAERAERRYSEELQALSARLVKIQEAERTEISRELHDEIGQSLTSLALSLEAAMEMPKRAPAILSTARSTVQDLQECVRSLSLDLRPSMLDDLGLAPALTWLFERVEERMNLTVHAKVDPSLPPLPPDAATAAYRIVQESLTNVAKHAGVDEATVRVRAEEGGLALDVTDTGQGMETDTTQNGKSGLLGMAERARRLGGSLTVTSERGSGTTVSAHIPWAQPSAE